MSVRSELDTAWLEWLKDTNAANKRTQAWAWRRDNQEEWAAIVAYREGTGPRPTNVTSIPGVEHLKLTDAWLLTAPVEPPPPPPPPPPGSGFRVQGTQILRPDGQVWHENGINLVGPHSWWPSQTLGHSGDCQKWGFGIVRLNTCMPGGCHDLGYDWPTNNDLAAIVSEYTGKGIVVMLASHQPKPGTWPGDSGQVSVASLAAWWKQLAATYKDNPYVWFNLINEPGNGPVTQRYFDVHRTLGLAVRSEAPDSVIVVDGTQWGQDAGAWNSSPVLASNSGILTYGKQLRDELGNVVFSFHVYDQWGISTGATDAQRDGRLADYIDRCRALGLALIVGEAGWYGNKPLELQALATKSAYRVCPGKGIGIVAWHGQPGDGFNLVNEGEFWKVNAAASNLTWHGQLLWALR